MRSRPHSAEPIRWYSKEVKFENQDTLRLLPNLRISEHILYRPEIQKEDGNRTLAGPDVAMHTLPQEVWFQNSVAYSMGFEQWCGFWLRSRPFSWKIPGIIFFACVTIVAVTLRYESSLPHWFLDLMMPAMLIGMAAGFLLLFEIPFAYPVYVVNWDETSLWKTKKMGSACEP